MTDLVTREYLDQRLIALEQRLTIRLGTIVVVVVGVIGTVLKFIH